MSKSNAAVRIAVSFGVAGGLLAGGQAIVTALDGDQTDQAICSQQISRVVGLSTVCENYADSSWGGDF